MSRYFATGDEDQHQPMMWLQGYALYAAHVIVLGYVVSMLATTLLDVFLVSWHFVWLPFDSSLVLKGEVWRVLTYGLVNPPSIDFVIQMLLIAWFGREVEKYFGRRTFLRFYAGIYLVTPLLFSVIGMWFPLGRAGVTGSLALFVAFATLYPGAPMIFNLLAKWAALILVGIQTLIALDRHNWAELISLWATCGFAYAVVRHHQGVLNLPTIRFWKRRPKLRVLPDLEPAGSNPPAKNDPMAEVDALLDKIAKTGISSLTAKERARLDQAREQLRQKESRHR